MQIKTTKKGVASCYVKCKDCRMQLNISAGTSMMDAARTWNVRAQRRSALRAHDLETLTLLHSDIATAPHSATSKVSLDNTEKMWELALAAELASDMDTTPVRPDGTHFDVRYDVLFPYLDALLQEAAEEVRLPVNDALVFEE